MCEGYHTTGEDNHPDLEDEFLCEYVDGTMDPVVQEVFEEYVRTNPELREHIECLRDTRLLLCRYGCRCQAPNDLHARLRRELTCELMNGRVPFQILLTDRLKGVATVSTAMAILLLIGFLGGVIVVDTLDEEGTSMASVVLMSQEKSTPPPASFHKLRDADRALMESSRFSPRGLDAVRLGSSRPLVVRGLGNELRPQAWQAVAAFGSTSAFP
ncbi:MAG: hypothetical protein WD021_02555 [Rhodothermales bacterium]